jgi:hypothetical protein
MLRPGEVLHLHLQLQPQLPGRVIENNHSTDVETTSRVGTSVRTFTLKVSRASILVECLLSMTLPPEQHPPELRGVPLPRQRRQILQLPAQGIAVHVQTH